MHRIILLTIFLFASVLGIRAAEPFFKPGDVVAFVGGEDMVVAAELGYLETLIQLALPDHKLKFRSLAREGDTVFEQRRDLNYPKLEDQLDKIGATVVICQFGQMESLAGKEKVGEFVAAYEKLIGRLSGGGKRRMILCEAYYMGKYHAFQPADLNEHYQAVFTFNEGIHATSVKTGARFEKFPGNHLRPSGNHDLTSDGIRLSNWFQVFRAASISQSTTGVETQDTDFWKGILKGSPAEKLGQLSAAKNRLWFHYYRPQNWAFLAGDRTNQPSSRDHIDRNKRWFPEELEKFVPLIDAKDAEIWALAKKLAAGGGK